VGGLDLDKKKKQTAGAGLFAITLSILLIILSIAGIVQVNVNEALDDDLAKEKAVVSIDGVGLNNSERAVLGLFYGNKDIPLGKPEEKNSTYHIYLESLRKYFSSTGVELSKDKADQMVGKIGELFNIIQLEDEEDFPDMSIDGKGIAIDISKQIYKLCGLNLKTNREGTIEYIASDSGTEIYRELNPEQNIGFHAAPVLVTVSSITTLFGLIFYVSRRNQITKREVGYSGFDAQRFA
jgi:hypothetical protein